MMLVDLWFLEIQNFKTFPNYMFLDVMPRSGNIQILKLWRWDFQNPKTCPNDRLRML
jgi:hypothetical protein